MHIRRLLAIAILLYTPIARADLIPPGGEGVDECRGKKAGDACQLPFFEQSGIRLEDGKCVEAKLDHLPLKFKANLRCEVPPKPVASASAVASATPSAAPSVVPPAPSATPAPSIANEPPKSSGSCSISHANEIAGFGWMVFVLGMLIRRVVRKS